MRQLRAVSAEPMICSTFAVPTFAGTVIGAGSVNGTCRDPVNNTNAGTSSNDKPSFLILMCNMVAPESCAAVRRATQCNRAAAAATAGTDLYWPAF